MALEPVTRQAPDRTLLAESDRPVALSSFYDEATAVFVFLRHFG